MFKLTIWFVFFSGLMLLAILAGLQHWSACIAVIPPGLAGGYGTAAFLDHHEARRKYRKLIASTRRADCGQHIRYGS